MAAVKFINKVTGGVMYVAEERADEYKAAGHKLVASASKRTAPKEAEKKGKAKK